MRAKNMMWCISLLGLGLPMVAGAQEGDLDPFVEANKVPPIIRVQVEWIEMKHEVLTELMAKPRTSTNDTALRAKVGDLVKAGKATVQETMICVAQDEEKAATESVEEYIYPTEYDPPEMFTFVPDQLTTLDINALERAAVGPNPTAFEMRALGSSLEVLADLHGSAQVVDLNVDTQIVYHCRNEVWREWDGVRGDASIKMPVMYQQSLQTQVTMIDGQPLMVATVSPKSESGFPDYTRKLMLFLRCDVLKVEK